MKALQYLNKYLVKYKWNILRGLLFVIVSNIFLILPAQMVRYAMDLVVDNIMLYKSVEGVALQGLFFDFFAYGILIYASLILCMAVLRGLFLYLVRQTIIVTSRLIEYDLKNEIFAHYQALPLLFYRKNSTGDLMNRISEDVNRVRMYLGPSIMYGLQLVTLFTILIPIMYNISPVLTGYALIPLPMLSFSIYFVNNIIERQSEKIQRSQSQLSTFVQETFSGIRILKSFAKEKESAENFSIESDYYMAQSLKLTRVQALFIPLIMAFIGLSTLLAVYAGSAEVIEGSLTFGNIAEFIIYVNLLTWPVASLGWVSSLVQRAEASQKRINEFLNFPIQRASKKDFQRTIRGKIEFKNVSFVYPDTGIIALKNVSFIVQPGDSLAIIGSTGSGKSTIINLIGRLYDTYQGEILIDDILLEEYNLANIRSQIGFVLQDVFLFSDTIYNNIAFGICHAHHQQVEKAAKDADVYENVMDFPQGFKTRVGERGVMLSGGQKQRISIARAIVRDPKILILDDVLSAVDTKTENTILNSMSKIMQERTSLVVSHRVSSAKLASRIIMLDDGRIIEDGTHDSLLAKAGGAYQILYDKQMQGSEKEH